MKNLIFMLTFLFPLFCFGQDCEQPFISEIVFDVQVLPVNNGGSPENGVNSFAVEIFNPLKEEISLSGYTLELVKSGNEEPTIVELSGWIDAQEALVLTNETANEIIQDLSDFNVAELDFLGCIAIRLNYNGETLDQIGNADLNGQGEPINLAAILNDPSLIEDLKIDLSSIKQLTARRSNTVVKGDPFFTTETLLQDWMLFPSSVLDGLGEHFCACVAPVVCFVTNAGFIGEGSTPPTNAYSTSVSCSGCDGVSVEVKSFYDGGSSGCVGFAPATPTVDFTGHGTSSNPSNSIFFTSSGTKSMRLFTVVNDVIVEPTECASFGLSVPIGGSTSICFGLFSQHSVRILDNDMVSTTSVELDMKVGVSPNITEGQTAIIHDADIIVEKILVYNTSGMVEETINYVDNQKQFDLSHITSGYKRIVVFTNKGIFSKPLIKL